ncbi:WD repeat-containing protein 43-like protein [Tanacetum coccineum]
MFNGGVEMLSLYMRCSTDESRCYRYTLDVQRMSLDAIVVHEMFNGGVEMLSLNMRSLISKLAQSKPLVKIWITVIPCSGSSISNALPYKIKETVKRICPQVIEIVEPPKEGYQLTIELDFSKAFFQIAVGCRSWVCTLSTPCLCSPFLPPELRGDRLSDLSSNEGHRMGAVAACALPWLRSLPLQHASFIMSEEASLIALNSLYQTGGLNFHKNRCCCIPDLLIVNCRAALDIVWMLIFPAALDIVWILNFVAALDTVWVLNFPEPWKCQPQTPKLNLKEQPTKILKEKPNQNEAIIHEELKILVASRSFGGSRYVCGDGMISGDIIEEDGFSCEEGGGSECGYFLVA